MADGERPEADGSSDIPAVTFGVPRLAAATGGGVAEGGGRGLVGRLLDSNRSNSAAVPLSSAGPASTAAGCSWTGAGTGQLSSV